jgi:predicted peroxiredoxin
MKTISAADLQQKIKQTYKDHFFGVYAVIAIEGKKPLRGVFTSLTMAQQYANALGALVFEVVNPDTVKFVKKYPAVSTVIPNERYAVSIEKASEGGPSLNDIKEEAKQMGIKITSYHSPYVGQVIVELQRGTKAEFENLLEMFGVNYL